MKIRRLVAPAFNLVLAWLIVSIAVGPAVPQAVAQYNGTPLLPTPRAPGNGALPPGVNIPPELLQGQPSFGDQGQVNIYLGEQSKQGQPSTQGTTLGRQGTPLLTNPCPAGGTAQTFQVLAPPPPSHGMEPQQVSGSYSSLTLGERDRLYGGGSREQAQQQQQQQQQHARRTQQQQSQTEQGRRTHSPDPAEDVRYLMATQPPIEELSSIEAAFQIPIPTLQGVAQLFPEPQAAPRPYARDPDRMMQPRESQFAHERVASRPSYLGPYGSALRQFGYQLFAWNVSTFAPVDDMPVGPDYVIGPGDDLTINVWGSIDTTVVRTVDRSGRIILPKVGDVRVWGLTFAQADRLIREQLSRYFRGFQTSVTMGRLRTVRVYVVGEVCRPGAYTVSSLSTLSNALFSAGGPTKLGSLRQIRLQRNGHTVGTLDLYDFLLRGDRTRDYRLESGDTIFIPTIGPVAAVAGEVKRPAIYELRGDARVTDLLDMAGGLTPRGYLKRVQIVRAQPSAERVSVDVDVSKYYLKGEETSNPRVESGDLVLIHQSDTRIYNTVKLDGAVKYAGAYELKPMMRISELLPPDRVLPEAFTERVEISRRRPDHSVEILAVNLTKAWGGDTEQDLMLKPLDVVSVRTEFRESRTVSLTGQVVRPGRYLIAEGERLSSVLERAGGFTDRAYPRGAVYTRTSLRKVEQEQLDEFIRQQDERILAAASTVVVGAEAGEAAAQQQAILARREQLRALASRVVLGRMVVRLSSPPQLRGSQDDVVMMDGDTLDVPEPPSSVLVVGSVRNSTSVAHKSREGVEYYVNRVGGFSKGADRKEVHVVKADGSAVAGFSKIRDVDPGDTIIVPPKEEEKVRLMPMARDALSVMSTTLLSLLALAVLF